MCLTLCTVKVDPRQEILGGERQDDERDLSIDIRTEAALSTPLETQDNGKRKIQKENKENDCVHETWRVAIPERVEEVSNDNGPTENVGNETKPV